MGNKGKLKISRKIPSELRIFKRKIEKVMELEKQYWKEIQQRKYLLNELDGDLEDNMESIFPSNISIRIYGCKDGIILLRYVLRDISPKFEIFYTHSPLDSFHNNVPIPTISGEIPMAIPLGENNLIAHSTINQVPIHWLSMSSYLYKDTDLIELEDAVTDFGLYIIGMLNGHNFVANNKRVDEKNIIEKLKKTIVNFEGLLTNAKVEEEVQQFLKENPIIIQPHTKVIPKQKLGEDFVTDFVLVNLLDQGFKYTFVEIEKPNMPILTKNNEFRAEFRHAEKQILDWDNWLQENSNYIKTKLKGFQYPPTYLIIGGRSKDMEEKEKEYIKAYNRKNEITFLTYDDVLKKAWEFVQSLENSLKEKNR